jgi:Ni/Fe-hydrogenase 1 B-type cytochrome subunit
MYKLNLKQYQPSGLRIWHWSNAFVILGLLATVLLRKTFLNWRANSALIEAKISDSGLVINHDVAVGIAKAIRDVMWEWHINLGFMLVALIMMRVIVALTAKRFPSREAIDVIRAISLAGDGERASAVHLAGVKLSHVGFYLIVVFMTASGLGLYFAKGIGLTKSITDLLKQSHEFAMWFVVAFVGAHLIGVVLAELGGNRGIISEMIHGGDNGE